MTVRELSNRYYTWNDKTVFLWGNQQHLWDGGECELLVCEKNAFRAHLYESPFQTTDERIPITEQVLSELKPIPIKCKSCVYCWDIMLPVGRDGIRGFEHGKTCDLKGEVNIKARGIPDGLSLSPDCPCYTDRHLTKYRTEPNEELEKLSHAAFHTYKAWFIRSDYGLPDEAAILSLFRDSKSLYMIDYNEISESTFEENRETEWTIRAWCEIPVENNPTQALRSIWDATFFTLEGTAAICSLEKKRLVFLPFESSNGYYVFSENREDAFLESHGKRVQWRVSMSRGRFC